MRSPLRIVGPPQGVRVRRCLAPTEERLARYAWNLCPVVRCRGEAMPRPCALVRWSGRSSATPLWMLGPFSVGAQGTAPAESAHCRGEAMARSQLRRGDVGSLFGQRVVRRSRRGKTSRQRHCNLAAPQRCYCGWSGIWSEKVVPFPTSLATLMRQWRRSANCFARYNPRPVLCSPAVGLVDNGVNFLKS